MFIALFVEVKTTTYNNDYKPVYCVAKQLDRKFFIDPSRNISSRLFIHDNYFDPDSLSSDHYKVVLGIQIPASPVLYRFQGSFGQRQQRVLHRGKIPDQFELLRCLPGLYFASDIMSPVLGDLLHGTSTEPSVRERRLQL